ncbi:MAG: 3-oxoacyl-ACP reductase family protein [bacterium]
MSDRLRGKRALITGASRGIGRQIALDLARESARLIVTYQSSRKEVDDLTDEIGRLGGEVFAVSVDVADSSDVTMLFNEVDRRLGGVDILINNAGVLLEKPLLETTDEEFDRLMNINLRGQFIVGREAIRRMVNQRVAGRVINISSDLGSLGREDFSVYSASKGGVNALTKSWAREFAPDILVNAVAPGPIDTDMLGLATMSPEWREREADIPLQRVGTVEEVSALVVFIAGPASTFITGQIIGVNGGSVLD